MQGGQSVEDTTFTDKGGATNSTEPPIMRDSMETMFNHHVGKEPTGAKYCSSEVVETWGLSCRFHVANNVRASVNARAFRFRPAPSWAGNPHARSECVNEARVYVANPFPDTIV